MKKLSVRPGILEGQTLTGDNSMEVDVCIVGSGPGGSIAALRLSELGLKVLLIEQGGYYTQQYFRMDEAESFRNLYEEAGSRNTDDLAIQLLHGKTVGGGSVINWGTCIPFPVDLLKKWQSSFQIESIAKEDLLVHEKVLREDLFIHKVTQQQINQNNRILYEGCKKVGIDVSLLERNDVGCAGTGYCGMGCPINAKQSTLINSLPAAMDRGATIVSRCRLDQIHHKNGEITLLKARFLEADGRALNGATLEIKARKYILACGALGTSFQLLSSGIEDLSKMTGKRIFLHPSLISVGIYADPVNAFYGIPQTVASHHFRDRGAKVGFFMEAAPVHPGLASMVFPVEAQEHRQMMNNLPFISAHLALMIDGHQEGVEGGILSVNQKGHRKFQYPIKAALQESFAFAQQRLAEIQLSMGAKRVLTTHTRLLSIKSASPENLRRLQQASYRSNDLFLASAHQMGGAMMSDDPERGVVSSFNGQHHQLKNLHIMDSSVFPTSLGVNPQMTIFTLCSLWARRLAEQMLQE